MTDEELQAWVQALSQTAFSMEFSHRAYFNARLRTTGGRYRLADHNIEINPKMLGYGKEVVAGIIKHELCHYHLHLAGLGYRHKDRDFKRLLAKVGGSRYAPTEPKQRKYHYQCTNCQQDYFRQRLVNTDKYVCSKCHGHLALVGLAQKN